MKMILKKVVTGDPPLNEHIAQTEGIESYERSFHYEDLNTGDMYSHVCGGVSWPTKDHPGYCCVVGVLRSDGPEFKILQEFESKYFSRVYSKCIKWQEMYGGKHYEELFRSWWGDCEASMTLVSERNLKHVLPGNINMGVHVTNPPDLEDSDCFNTYLNRITACLGEEKSLWLGDAFIIKGKIEAFADESVGRLLEKHAAISVVGFTLHALHQYRPWLNAVHVDHFERGDSYEAEHKRTMKLLGEMV